MESSPAPKPRDNLGAKPGAALGAARVEDGAAPGRTHTGAKTVSAFTLKDTGLERSFHNTPLIKSTKGREHYGLAAALSTAREWRAENGHLVDKSARP